MVLNSAAHIITRSLSIDQISPVLQKLHLLPLILRFCFSPLRPFISLLLCIFLNSFIYTPSHTLRASSATQPTTVSPRCTTVWSSELSPTRHSFTVLTLSTLKSCPRTHLIKTAYTSDSDCTGYTHIELFYSLFYT